MQSCNELCCWELNEDFNSKKTHSDAADNDCNVLFYCYLVCLVLVECADYSCIISFIRNIPKLC